LVILSSQYRNARLPTVSKSRRIRITVDAYNSFSGPDAVAFQEQPKAKNSVFLFDPHIAQRFGLGGNPSNAAEKATITLVALSIMAMLFERFMFTGGSYHNESLCIFCGIR
jgi:hypothetical protein